ncbi:MAG TPA: hypothetical protein VNR87_04415 [Flavisolibacter sp.]|nr:hypothetical protein [Flavisolibacter sp.]
MKVISGFLLLCPPFLSRAQKADVENAVRDHVDGFYYGDTRKIIKSISPRLVTHGFYLTKNKEGYQSDTMLFRQSIDYAANVTKRGVSPNV